MGKEKSRQFAGFVWMKGLEPSTSWSLTRCATNCATSRIWDCKDSNFLNIRIQKMYIFSSVKIVQKSVSLQKQLDIYEKNNLLCVIRIAMPEYTGSKWIS